MASITIRNLSEESKERLRQRAKLSGCSLEALVRNILNFSRPLARDITGVPLVNPWTSGS